MFSWADRVYFYKPSIVRFKKLFQLKEAARFLLYILHQERKRAVTIHVSDSHGDRLQGASITIEQISKDFPFGSAIASTILGNLPYQVSSAHVLVLQKNGN